MNTVQVSFKCTINSDPGNKFLLQFDIHLVQTSWDQMSIPDIQLRFLGSNVNHPLRPIECSMCDRKFPARTGKHLLEKHIQKVHEGVAENEKNKVTARARTFVKNIFNQNFNLKTESNVETADLRNALATGNFFKRN